MRLFLSSAVEDEAAAEEVAAWLDREGFEVYHWRGPRWRGGRFLEQIEQYINQADAFLAVLSPNFLGSPWCLLERDLAIHREQDLQPNEPGRVFIYVLHVAETPPPQANSLRRYDWFDLTTAATKEEQLPILADQLRGHSGTWDQGDRACASAVLGSRL
jgi:TIR domain